MQNVNEAPTYIHQFDKDEQIISTQDLSVFYGGSVQKLFNASLQFKKKNITALIGGSGSGKSTLVEVLSCKLALEGKKTGIVVDSIQSIVELFDFYKFLY